MSGKVVWALPAKNISVYSVFGRWTKYPIFVGEAHATGAAGVLFKSIIQGRLKTVISGFPSRNPCFQMTSTKMGQGSVGFAREKYIGLFCFWVMSKIS